MSKTYSKTRTLVECALMIALGTVLANIKIFEMPNGGSITLLSMLPFILVSYRHGTKWGLFTGFVNSLLQMLLGFYAPPAPGLLPLVGMILLDYVLAFTLLGLAGAIAKPFKNRLVGVAVGTAAVCGISFSLTEISWVQSLTETVCVRQDIISQRTAILSFHLRLAHFLSRQTISLKRKDFARAKCFLLILFRAELSTMTSLRNTMLQSSLTASGLTATLSDLKTLRYQTSR